MSRCGLRVFTPTERPTSGHARRRSPCGTDYDHECITNSAGSVNGEPGAAASVGTGLPVDAQRARKAGSLAVQEIRGPSRRLSIACRAGSCQHRGKARRRQPNVVRASLRAAPGRGGGSPAAADTSAHAAAPSSPPSSTLRLTCGCGDRRPARLSTHHDALRPGRRNLDRYPNDILAAHEQKRP